MYDIIVIGAGPAGMTAAIYGRRGGKKVLMIEKEGYGGQIINTPALENYPGFDTISGMEFSDKIYKQAMDWGAEMEYGTVDDITLIDKDKRIFKVSTEEGKEYETKSVILATGVKSRPIGIDREEELVGRGVSYCAACDGAFFRDKTVVILGGGNTALTDAEVLADLCKKVYIVHRRMQFRGDNAMVERLKKRDNVEMVLPYVPVELLGDEKITGIKIKNRETEEIRTIDTDGIFVAFGNIPQNEAFRDAVGLDDAGYVVAAEDCVTDIEGIFTAGDCRTKKVRQVVTATGDGSVAAVAAIEYLNSRE